MRHAWAVVLAGLAAGTVAGCAYYNGLYNANRLAKDANKAAREGRSGEARSLWSQAAVKAESVAVRYPESKYRDDAMLLQGRALSASGQCHRALAPLHAALESSADSAIRQRARLLLGRCHVELGDAQPAIAVLTPLTEVADSSLSASARLWRGRALIAEGAYSAARADLEMSGEPDAAFDLAVAYAHMDQPANAREALERRLSGTYAEDRWLATLDVLGATHLRVAAAVVDGLVQERDLTPGERGRLLLADGERWARRDSFGLAIERYDAVLAVARDSAAGRMARVRRIVAELRVTADVARLPVLLGSLQTAGSEGGAAARSVAPFVDLLRGVVLSVRKAEAEALVGNELRSGNADLWLFLAAEAVRDSLGASPLAAALFERMAAGFPESPIAPKALLAAAVIHPAVADSLLLVLFREYPTSPYTLALSGTANQGFAAIEDSLRTLLAAGRDARP